MGKIGLSSEHSIRVRLQPGVFPEYLQLVLSNQGVKDWLSLESMGSTMDNLNTSILSRVPLPLPSFDEHKSIVEAVWLANDSIDALLARIQVGIKRLQEYRTALISTAVTGKIDVREST